MNHKREKIPSDELIEEYSSKTEYKFASADSAREARFVFAYYRRNQHLGYPIYIVVGKHHYKRFEHCEPHERTAYFGMLQKQWKSQYFDTLLPLKNAMTDEELKQLHADNLFDQLERIFEE